MKNLHHLQHVIEVVLILCANIDSLNMVKIWYMYNRHSPKTPAQDISGTIIFRVMHNKVKMLCNYEYVRL